MIQFLSGLMVVGFAVFGFLAGPALAVGTSDGSSETAGTPFDEAKALVDEGSYAVALTKLEGLVKADPQNADAWNLLGFTYRKLDQLDESDAAYLKVLAINPDHLGALEYQGELFITQGKIDAAKANLAKLQGLCGTCEEAEDLEKALKKAAS